MSGHECSDFGAVNIANNLCRMPAGTPYEGLIAYRDGRITADPANGPMANAEIGNCAAQGGPVAYSSLQSVYNGASVDWAPDQLRALHRALGQRPGQSGNAFFCANPENARELAINSAVTYRPSVLAAIGSLTEARSRFPEFDDLHYEAALHSLRAIAVAPEPETMWDKIKGAATYMLGGVAVFALGGLAAHIAGKWWDGRGGPRGGSGSGSGGDGGTLLGDANRSRDWASTERNVVRREGVHVAFWAGVAGACFLGAGALLADDATVVGVLDDPLAGGAAVLGVIALGIHHVTE